MKHTRDWIQKTNENMNEFIEFEKKMSSKKDISMYNITKNRRGQPVLRPKHPIEMIHSETMLKFIYETQASFVNLTMRIAELETNLNNLKSD